MATVEVRLPQWGMGMQEGEVTEWMKKEGEAVAEGEDLVEIEAAKTTEVIVAPVGGTISKILQAEGAVVPVREVLALIETQD